MPSKPLPPQLESWVPDMAEAIVFHDTKGNRHIPTGGGYAIADRADALARDILGWLIEKGYEL